MTRGERMQPNPFDLLEANLNALAPATRRALDIEEPDTAGRTAPGRVQPPSAVLTPDGRWVRMHSERDPALEAERFLSRALPDGVPPTLLLLAPGLGYLLDAIERRGARPRTIVVHPFPDIVRAMLSRRSWVEWLESGALTLLVGPSYPGAQEAWRLIDMETVPPAVLAWPVFEREFPAAMAEARQVAARAVYGARSNQEARLKFAGRYLLNTLGNLPAICAEGDVRSLAGCFQQSPAFVVAAGPSLDRSLEDLRRLRSRALTIAVDTALRPLIAAGMPPDLVVAVDPQHDNARHLLGLPHSRDCWLVAEGSLDPSGLELFAGRSFVYRVSDHHPWPWLSGLDSDRGLLKAWGSVLTTAFDLACLCGCDPIIFLGADLAYTDGLLYCRRTLYEADRGDLTELADRVALAARDLRTRPTCLAPDLTGSTVQTAPHFIQFRDFLVARARQLAGRRIWNATGAGILFGDGIVPTPLTTLALPDPPSHRPSATATLVSAWKASTAGRETARAGVARVLMGRGSGIPLEEWLAFAGAAVSRDEITRRLCAAAAALGGRAASGLA